MPSKMKSKWLWGERRLRRTVVIHSITGISRMINSRREILYMMAQNLTKGPDVDRVYRMRTIYQEGPRVLKELNRLLAIRDSLRKYLMTI